MGIYYDRTPRADTLHNNFVKKWNNMGPFQKKKYYENSKPQIEISKPLTCYELKKGKLKKVEQIYATVSAVK